MTQPEHHFTDGSQAFDLEQPNDQSQIVWKNRIINLDYAPYGSFDTARADYYWQLVQDLDQRLAAVKRRSRQYTDDLQFEDEKAALSSAQDLVNRLLDWGIKAGYMNDEQGALTFALYDSIYHTLSHLLEILEFKYSSLP